MRLRWKNEGKSELSFGDDCRRNNNYNYFITSGRCTRKRVDKNDHCVFYDLLIIFFSLEDNISSYFPPVRDLVVPQVMPEI